MKKIVFLLILFIFTQIMVGCQGQTPSRLDGLLGDIDDNQVIPNTNQATADSEVKTAGLSAPAANYYPDAGLPTVDSNATVVLTDKLKMKLYLIEKYKPGLCFGKPAGVSQEAIALYLRENAALAQFVSEYYKTGS
jgi:hypothetical protein